jgi:lipopolysaccharide transport system ATP-binding protein
MNQNIAIRVENLSKKYAIGKQKDESLRGSLAGFFSRKKSATEDFWALQDVSFDILQGDVVGIVGKNGAGKSTLLKILSEITKPSNGRIEINGRIASLLEVGTGFHPELTGRENIFLNGTILGMTKREIKNKFDDIVDFSGVEKFIDTPVKHYSSGMYVRLAFAVAANLSPEILVIDEVLAVGDADFQKKCLGKMQDVANNGRTVLFVSHNMAAIKTLCNKGILLSSGKKTFEGSALATLENYNSNTLNNLCKYDTSDVSERKRGAKHIYINSVELSDSIYYPTSNWNVNITLGMLDQTQVFKKIDLSVFIFDSLQNTVFQLSTSFLEIEVLFSTSTNYSFSIDRLNLTSGIYSVGIWLSGNGFEQDYISDLISFEVGPGSIYVNQTPHIVSIIQKEFNFAVK